MKYRVAVAALAISTIAFSAMRATGQRATAIRFQQFGEGGSYGIAR